MAGAPQPGLSARIILTAFCIGSAVSTDPEEAGQKLYVSPQPVQWIEGQQMCAEREQRLLNSEDFTHSEMQEELVKFRPKSQFWIGDVKRVSEWIYILGCYNRTSIQHLLSNPVEFTKAMSPARCQETCWNVKKSRYFALRQNQCYCLPADANLQSGRLTQISECNHQCGLEEPKACGSSDRGTALSVYKTSKVSDNTDQNSRCCKIECSDIKRFTATWCSEPQMPYCSTTVKGISAYSWDNANAMCRQNGGYLDGRADLDYPPQKCQEIHRTFPNQYVFWVGIRRQSFETQDTGYPIDSKTVETCQYFDTNDANRHVILDCTVQKYSVCVMLNIQSKNIDSRTSEFPSEDTERGDTGSIVGGVLGAVFVVATVLISLILYIRWRRRRLFGAQTKLEYTRQMAQKGSHQDPREAANRAEETGTEGEVYYSSNDDYDVLGGRRLKVTTESENVYNQTEDACTQNDYAHTDQFSNRKSMDDDNLYDHTNDDKYMYGTIVATDDNSNLYGQSDS